MFISLKKYLREDFINLRGWSSKRKIIVIESDDWGTIRTSSKIAFQSLINQNFPLELDPYSRFDALESDEDLEALFDVLHPIRDSQGNSAIFTANNVVANPDLEKIKGSDFYEYHYEPFTETLNKYPKHRQVEKLYREGIKSKIFRPQFHGREHLHVNNWMKALQNKDPHVHLAFENQMATVFKNKNAKCKDQFLDGFAVYTDQDEILLNKSIKEGCKLFKDIWGYNAKSVISPCLIWHPNTEKTFKSCGLDFIQSGPKQIIPQKNGLNNISKRHYMGKKNKNNQVYSIRNVEFEPSIDKTNDIVSKTLNSIQKAFNNNKPAIISSHRLNYIGFIHEENRKENLKLLKELLQKALTKWPDIEFMSSDELSMHMQKET